MADETSCLRCGSKADPEALCPYCGGEPRSLRNRAPTSLRGTTRGRLGGRARPPLGKRQLCGRCGVAVGAAGRCEACGASAGVVAGQGHEGGCMWVRVEISVRCRCGQGAWQRVSSPGSGVACRACGCSARLQEGQLRALVRQAHGAADLGGGGEGLHGLRWLPLGQHNPHRDLGLSGQAETLDDEQICGEAEASSPELRLRLAPGHPRCAGCGGPLGLARRPALRAAGKLQCQGCRSGVPSSPWLASLDRLAPLRAALEEREEGEEARHYRVAGESLVAALWLCFEGPSWQRLQIEQQLLRGRRQEAPAEARPWGWGFAGAALGGMSLMAAIQPPRWVRAEQVTELRGVALLLFLVAIGLAVGCVVKPTSAQRSPGAG